MGKFNYFAYQNKKIEKLTFEERFDLLFDLINAFSLTKSPLDSALLLQDLLTESETKNLSKRLRIAKLLLSGLTQIEIAKDLHCSFATVAKISMWLNLGGEGIKKVVRQLPKRKKIYDSKRIPGIGYTLPQFIAYIISSHSKAKQNKMLQSLVNSTRTKTDLDKDFREEITRVYKGKK